MPELNGIIKSSVQLNYLFSTREGNEKSYQLLRDSLDLYLTISPDNVQYLLLQARLYFHLGIWPEKVRLQLVDPFSKSNLPLERYQ